MKVKNNILNIFMNIFYSLSSNLFTMIATTTVTLIIPKFIGVEDYSYWQLYLFYASYSGYFHFGWNDGFLLRYSGKKYNEITTKNIHTQILIQTLFMVLITIAIITLYYFTKINIKNYIFIAFCINIIIINIRYLLLCIYQCTSQFKKFAYVNIFDRLIFIIALFILWKIGLNNHKGIIIADLIGKVLSLILALIGLEKIIFLKPIFSKPVFLDIWENVKVGIKLMASSLANMLILGITRFKIELAWDLIVFGKISLCISIINLFVTFINSIGIIVFQLLFNIKKSSLSECYLVIRFLLIIFLAGLLSLYFPVNIILSKWLPDYADSLQYMIYLFPMCLFESKMLLLDASFLKIYRLENKLLYINVISVIISFILSLIAIDINNSIILALFFVSIISFLRCCLAEICLMKVLNRSVIQSSIEEGVLSLGFIFSAILFNNLSAFFVYIGIYIIFLFVNRDKIYNTICIIKAGFEK